MNSDINIVLPLGHSQLSLEQPPGLSITRSAKELAKLLSTAQLNRIKLFSVGNAHMMGKPTIASIFFCARPADLVIWKDSLKEMDYVCLLVHDQDKFLKFEQHIIDLKAKVLCFTADAKAWLEKLGVKAGLVPLPFPFDPSSIPKNLIADTLQNANHPRVVLWCAPHMRKNSLQGFFATMEAVRKYGSHVDLLIVVGSSGGFQLGKIYNLLENMPVIRNVKVEVTVAPAEIQKLTAFANANIVVFPSFDEGYHIPAYEAAPFMPTIVMSDCSANQDFLRQYATRSGKTHIFKTTETEIVGTERDEMSFNLQTVMMPDYFSMVDAISAALKDWGSDRKSRATLIRQGQFMNSDRRRDFNAWSSNLGLQVRQKGSTGRAYVEVI